MATGFCKLCASPWKAEVNKRLNRGESLVTVMTWLKGKDFPVSKPTLINHKKHITDPKTTFVEQAQRNPVIKRATNDDFLQAVVDAAASKVAENPEDVTIEQGLKAAGIREARREKKVDIWMIVSQLATERRPLLDEIQGEFTELNGLNSSEASSPVKELTANVQ